MRGAVRQVSLREHNLALLAHSIADGGATPSRSDLAQQTGLDRATVGRLVTELIDGGLVTEGEPRTGGGAGRPGRPLRPAPGTVAGIGLEANVDYLGVRVVDLAGQVLAERVESGDFRDSAPAPALRRLGELARAVTDELPGVRFAGAVAAVPGLVDPTSDRLLRAPNLGWRDVDVVAGVGRLPGGPLRLGNEAHLAALAEAAARPGASFLFISGEVGIGAAIVRSGEIFGGEHGWSGELGHVAVDPVGARCRCGATGCLETVLGSDALLTAAGLDVTAGLTALASAIAAGDEHAAAAVERAARALAIAAGSMVNLLDVSTIVVGNALGALTEDLRSVLERDLAVRVLASPWATPLIETARAGDHPALTGATRAALGRVWADPAAWLAGGGTTPAGPDDAPLASRRRSAAGTRLP